MNESSWTRTRIRFNLSFPFVLQLIPQPLLFQMEAFCIEFGRLREATALFSHMKELEAAEMAAEAAIAKALDIEDEDKSKDENKNEATKGAILTKKPNETNSPSPKQNDTKLEL